MKKLFTLLLLIALPATFNGQPAGLMWTTQSRNSSESMPCGGGDIGLNVWTENHEILFYLSRSGTFDENNTLLKLCKRISRPDAFSWQPNATKKYLASQIITMLKRAQKDPRLIATGLSILIKGIPLSAYYKRISIAPRFIRKLLILVAI